MANHRLIASSNGYVSTYIYDGEGQRALKQYGGNEVVYTNGAEAAVRTEAPHYSLYANPYFVMHDGERYTEHIYIGSERVAVHVAKLGANSSYIGNFENESHAGNGISPSGFSYSQLRQAQEAAIAACYDSLGYSYSPMNHRDAKDIVMVPTGFDENHQQRYVYPDIEEERDYYYSTDHLGSSRLVLDSNGQIAEKLMFLPTGEVFKDEQNSSYYHSDFLFSGKELDAETGNYYYGARYLAPRLGIWLSPDPMQLKYPHVSSYAYCMGNPVKLIDPDGRDYHVYIDEKTNTIRIYAIYYAATEDAESARKAISFWNNQSGKYKYKDKVVNFDLHVNEVEVDMRYGKVESVRRKVDEDKSKAANLYVTDLNLEKEANLNGRTTQGRYIKIKPSRRETNTGAHEIGHTLGVEHQYSGIMTAAETDSSRALKINKETIKTIMKQSSDRRNTNSYAGVGIRINVVNDN